MRYLEPLFDRIVVKELEEGEQTRNSGLLVPATATQNMGPPNRGVVLEVGGGTDWWESVGVEMPVSVGDEVMFPRNAGLWIEVEDEQLLVLRVGELLGVVRERPRASEAALRAYGDGATGTA